MYSAYLLLQPEQRGRNLYAGQEAKVRTLYGKKWLVQNQERSTIGLSAVTLFNLYAEHIMRNARLDELQAGIKIGGGIINNLIYADDTTLMAENEEELKSLLMRVKEESERVGLRLNIKKKLRSWHPAPLLYGK